MRLHEAKYSNLRPWVSTSLLAIACVACGHASDLTVEAVDVPEGMAAASDVLPEGGGSGEAPKDTAVAPPGHACRPAVDIDFNQGGARVLAAGLIAPDLSARYAAFGLSTDRPRKLGYRIQGKFPSARYFSIKADDTSTGAAHPALHGTMNPIQGAELRASAGANPFIECVSEDDVGSYEVWLVPAGSALHTRLAAEGAQYIAIEAGAHDTMLFLRLYLASAETQLPTITAWDAKAPARPVSCAGRLSLPSIPPLKEVAGGNRPKFEIASTLDFYRVTAESIFPDSGASAYVYTELTALGRDSVVVVKARVPSFPDGAPGCSDEQTLYSSICSGSDLLAGTEDCVTDSEMLAGRNDQQGIIVASRDPSVADLAPGVGAAFLKVGDGRQPYLIFRQKGVSPEFKTESFLAVAPCQGPLVDCTKAVDAIGDWAPVAKYCSRASFAADGLSCHL